MARQNKLMRNLVAILKDKASLIKAALSLKRTTSSINVAVVRATSHSSSTSPPAEHHVAAVLSFGDGSRPTACACVRAIMDRLHNTHDAYVALKCLITLQHIVTRGSFILKDQLSFYPSAGGRNFLNLSRFRDGRDTETWELSSWVRWHASVLECNIVTSRVLATYISSSSSSSTKIDDDQDNGRVTITSSLNSDLLREVEALVGMVEEICRAPDSLHFQQNNLVYEVVNLVAGDYRSTQNQILIRLSGDRVNGLSSGESAELTGCLKRLEECRERLLALFVNRSRNDAFWDLVSETKMKVVKAEEERERSKRWLVRLQGKGEDASESTRLGERVGRPGQQPLRLPYGGEWLGVNGPHLTVAPTMA